MAYVDLTSRFVYLMQTVFGDFSKLANNDKFVNENGWQDGTVGVFFQAAAPTGWTKIITANARALRVVSGFGGGVGGTTDPATAITLAHTNSITADAAHTHALSAHNHTYHLTGLGIANGTISDDYIGEDGSNNLKRFPRGGFNSLTTLDHLMGLNAAYATGSGGSHDHGGATDSQLSNVSLAYANVIFASKDTSSGYTDLSSTFVHNIRHVYDYMSQLAANDAFNYARRTPAGTVSLFGSAAAPVGWTKLTTQDAKLLRIVNDLTGGSSGGTADPATTITLAHTHSDLTSGGSHSHTVPDHQHKMNAFGSVSNASASDRYILDAGATFALEGTTTSASRSAMKSVTATDGGGTSSTDGAHQHAIGSALTDVSLAYFNVIQASKDSAGAPTSYTDYTAFFVDQALLAYQDLQVMANNDAYLYFHTMPSTSVMFFFQSAAPLNWTKITTQNDKLLRIVSGSTGGVAGGSALLSSIITLAHTHSVDSKSHSHTYSHSHAPGKATVTANAIVSLPAPTYGNIEGSGAQMGLEGSGSNDKRIDSVSNTSTTSAGTDTYSHSHGGVTGSALTNLQLAYADVIQCSKN